MNLKAGLWQQQTLKLTMTQELTQAIALLQYTAQELSAFLEDKALENPLIKIETDHIRPINPLRERIRSKTGSSAKDQTQWIEQLGETKYSLEEHLMSQLDIKKMTPIKMKVMEYVIQRLDENGYYLESINDTAVALKISVPMVEGALKLIQCLEPAGIGARSLQECLLIQLEHQDEPNELAETIISEHFVPFAQKKWKEITKELNVTLKEIQDVFDAIQNLNPKPASAFIHEKVSYIIPDAIVEWYEGQLLVRIHDDQLPKISFNQQYYRNFSTSGEKQVNRFLQDKVQDYQWIFKGIEQRKETLTKVVSKIVEKQPDFFTKGQKHLQPMTMKDIATDLDIHESTVSRAVREKYVQTPIGTFALKTFFTNTIQTVSDGNTSSSQVKNKISLMIEKENKQKPISDQEIAETLESKEGIVVSRRTVAKYRDQLGIPSSSKRKRYE